MILLFDGCYCSDLKVHPINWKQYGANCKQDWYIHYRFYDPQFTDKDGKIIPRSRQIKGMNSFKTVAQRREVVAILINEELRLLKEEGYNPITRVFMAPVIEPVEYEIDPATPFIQALQKAKEKLSVTNRVKIGIKSVITGLDKAARQLRYDNLEVSKITRRHIKALLEQCSVNSKQWSNTRYNGYRGYLMMLYKELVELEAVPANPIWDISKKPVTQKIKVTLTDMQRIAIDEHLKENFPAFRNFIHLFFHSGGRKPELLQLKPAMVDLVNQKYKCIIKKRKNYTEVERTIKTVALPYWKYFLDHCPADHFLFGTLFKPGSRPMGEDMPTKYWRIFVKQQMGIAVDFYSLKHANSTEIVTLLDEAAAAAMNAHTSTAMVRLIYDVRQKDRQHERLKPLQNKFA